MTRFAGKVAIVTGGSSGIGAAVAARLAAEGATVVVADISAGDAVMTMDVSDETSVATAVTDIVTRHGRIDALVHCAGIGVVAPFLETTVAQWDRVIAVNLRGSFLVGQAVARVMVAQSYGAIVLVGSVSGERGNVDRAAYGASKGGVTTLGQVMACELAPMGVRVNVLAPGPVDTPLVAAMHDAASRAAWTRITPMGRYGTPEEIAAACAFLCSEDARYVTGVVLPVDGGMLAAGLARAAPER